MTDLLPCPFCGQDQAFPCFMYETDDRRLWHVDIECANCEAKIGERITFDEYASLEHSAAESHIRELAVKAWNTRAPSGWQDITTAPKDGTAVDLWCINHLHYAKKGERKCNVTWGVVTDWMGRERECWRHGHGEDLQPTHWMPLPEPPNRGATL